MAIPVDSALAASASHQEQVELDLLLEGLYQLYGDDFRGYERSPLRNKLLAFAEEQGIKTLSALLAQVMYERAVGHALIRSLLDRPSGLFEEPDSFKVLREIAGPLLRSYAAPKVWIAEVASVEEVFSIAIFLDEIGLSDKALIYATTPNEALLTEVREGTCSPDKLPAYAESYKRSGGKGDLSSYCIETGEGVAFAPHLSRNVIWSQFSLDTDTTFNEFQLIVCRTSLMAFAAPLRRRALTLFSESLSQFGLLCVAGAPELQAAPFSINYQCIAVEPGLYRRTAW